MAAMSKVAAVHFSRLHVRVRPNAEVRHFVKQTLKNEAVEKVVEGS